MSEWSRSVVSDSLWPHGLYPTKLLHPWDFPGKSTGVGCHFLLQRIFLTQGSNPGLLHYTYRQTFFTLWAATDLAKKIDFWANSPRDKKELGYAEESRKASVSLKEAERSDSSADIPQEELGADVRRCNHLGWRHWLRRGKVRWLLGELAPRPGRLVWYCQAQAVWAWMSDLTSLGFINTGFSGEGKYRSEYTGRSWKLTIVNVIFR